MFGKVGRMASEEVLFALFRTKCLPVLLYGTEVSPTNSAIQSLQFTLNKVFLNCLAPCLKNVTRKSVTTLVLVLLKK